MNGIFRIRSLFFSILLGFILSLCWAISLAQSLPGSRIQVNPYIPTIDIAQYALHEGDVRSANLLEGFIPIYQTSSNKLLFTDVRLYNPNGTPLEGNIDLGFRRLFHQGRRLLGFYGGDDRFRSETRNYFNQAHAGFEFWQNRFFVGGNVYVPVGTSVYNNDALNVASLSSTSTSYRYNIAFEAGKERALPGADAEVGYDITPSLTVYGGGYYFDHSDARSIAGPKLRATYTLYRARAHQLLAHFDRIRLEGLISHDSVRGTTWMAGLRFTFGFSNRFNPTTGLARHMADPIRRDLNVVSENYRLSPELYTINGNLAQVDIVSNSSGRTIDDAVDGDADIIRIIGSQTAEGELVIGGRDLAITGGQYDFTVNGQPYTVPKSGTSGTLAALSGAATLFNLSGGIENVKLEHLTIANLENDQMALENDGSFGHLTVDDITSNAPIYLSITGTDETGQLTFINNQINMTNSTAVSGISAQGLNGLGLVASSGNSLTVLAFNNNEIVLSNTSSGIGHMSALWAESGDSDNPILFATGIENNLIETSNFDASNDSHIYGFANQGIKINGSFKNNQLIAQGYSSVAGIYQVNAMRTFGSNPFILQNGTFSYNSFTARNYYATSGSANGWNINVETTISGNTHDNQFIVSNNENNGIGIQVTTLSSTDVTFGGDFYNNQFTTSNNGAQGKGINFTADYNLLFTGDVYNNQFTASNNGGLGRGWDSNAGGHLIMSSNFYNNTFNIFDNGVTGSLGLCMDDAFTIEGNMTNNQFVVSNNVGDATGWLATSEVSIGGNITHNTFTLANNGTSNVAIDFDLDTTSTIGGSIKGNTITIIDASEAATNAGFSITANDVTINFNQIIVNNLITINNDTSDEYGFSLDTASSGVINFNGTSSASELSSLNNDASITVSGSGTINYIG